MIHEGYLQKAGKRGPSYGFKRRWFVLTPDHLEYYETYLARTMSHRPLGTIHVKDIMLVHVIEASDSGYEFSFNVVTPVRVFVCYADSESEMNDWFSAFQQRIPPERVCRHSRRESVVSPPVSKAQKAEWRRSYRAPQQTQRSPLSWIPWKKAEEGGGAEEGEQNQG